MRFNAEGSTPTLRICRDDRWIDLGSGFLISNEESVILELQGRGMGQDGIVLSWEKAQAVSITSYDITCSSGNLDNTVHLNGGSEAAVLTRLAPSTDYQCCVTAHLNVRVFNLAMYTSTECVAVTTGPRTGGLAAPESGFSTVTYALGGLVGLLILGIVVVAVGCVCVVLSKRKYQVTHPRQVPTMHPHRTLHVHGAK